MAEAFPREHEDRSDASAVHFSGVISRIGSHTGDLEIAVPWDSLS